MHKFSTNAEFFFQSEIFTLSTENSWCTECCFFKQNVPGTEKVNSVPLFVKH